MGVAGIRRTAFLCGVLGLLLGVGRADALEVVTGQRQLASRLARTRGEDGLYTLDLLAAEEGELLRLSTADALAPGRYRIHLPLKVHGRNDPRLGGAQVMVRFGSTERVVSLCSLPSQSFRTIRGEALHERRGPLEITVSWALGERGRQHRLRTMKKPEAALPTAGLTPGGGAEEETLDALEDIGDELEDEPDDTRLPRAKRQAIALRLEAASPVVEACLPIVVTRLATDKVRYRPGEAVAATLEVRNLSDREQTVTARLHLRSTLRHTSTDLQQESLTLPPRGTLTRVFSVPAKEWWGHCLTAVLLQGDRTATRETCFSVHDSLWAVGIGHAEPIMTDDDRFRGHLQHGFVAGLRAKYSNWIDLFFYAPCDWACHASPLAEWWSGQTGYHHKEENLKAFAALCQREGLAMAAYASRNPAGPFGWAVARQHPDWFGAGGRITGRYNVEQLEKWNDPAWRATRPEQAWWLLRVDLTRLDALDYGIDRLLEGIDRYGWDAIRFDGHYTVGQDAVSTRNMRRLKERVWEQHPGLHLGYNYGRGPAWGAGGWTHELREAMAGGGMYMQEGIRNWRHSDQAYTSWRHYAENELRIARRIHAFGGHYHCIWDLHNPELTETQRLYKLIFGLIAGGHPAYGSHDAVSVGCENWGAFMTRWSELLWHRALRPAPEAAKRIEVDNDTLYWKPLVQERVVSKDERLVILHLVNPPTDDAIARGGMPEPVSTPTTLSYAPPPGETVEKAWVLHPERDMTNGAFCPVSERGGRSEVTLAQLTHWAVAVWQLRGSYTPVPAAPQFTEPPDLAAKGKATAAAWSDPNKRGSAGGGAADGRDWRPLDHGSANVGRPLVPDSDSSLGTVQGRRSDQQRVALGDWWVPVKRPGRYRFSLRVKWTDEKDEATPQMLGALIRDHESDGSYDKGPSLQAIWTTPGGMGAVEDAGTLKARGQYHEYIIGELDKWQQGCFNFTATATTAAVGPNQLFLEYLILERVRPFSDAEVAQHGGLAEKPEGLRAPQGAAPGKVLFVKGLFAAQYLEGLGGGVETCYSIPATYEDLYRWDAVVLANLSVPDVAARRRLSDFVQDGGRLVFLGGSHALVPDHLEGTFLEALLPVTLQGDGAPVPAEPALTLGEEKAAAGPGTPALFWYHRLQAGENAAVLAWAGQHPIAFRQPCGKGVVAVFAGTVLGVPGAGTTPFWQTPFWPILYQRLVAE